MSSSGGSVLINPAVVSRGGRDQSYSVLFDDQGVTGVLIREDQAGKPQADLFTIPWADIRRVVRRSGMVSWGLILDLASGDSCEIWLYYEHHPTSHFGKIRELFGDRAAFHAEPAPLWKVVALPAGLACCCAGVGTWLYNSVRGAEAEGDTEGLPLFVSLFGSKGVAVLICSCLLMLAGYALWLAVRELRTRGRP